MKPSMATQANGQTMKELFRLMRDVGRLFDGQVVDIHLDDDESHSISESESTTENSIIFFFTIKPNDGYYKGASCKFKVILEREYPDVPPQVTCCNTIYHPNIDVPDEDLDCGGSICVNLLDSDWQPEVGLDGCVMAILFLFYNPQLDDALSPVFEGSSMDTDEFAKNVKISMRGGEIDGVIFDKIINDDLDKSEDDSTNEDKDKIGVIDSGKVKEPGVDIIEKDEMREQECMDHMEKVTVTVGGKEYEDQTESNECVTAIDEAEPSENYVDGTITGDNHDIHLNIPTNNSDRMINLITPCQNNAICNNIDTSFQINTHAIEGTKVPVFYCFTFYLKNMLNVFQRLKQFMSCHNSQSSDR